MEYEIIPPAEAYRLLNGGGIVWVCTRSREGRYDLTPVAWNCPLDYEPSSRVIVVLDPGHAAAVNLRASGEFALALPDLTQKELVIKTGSVSGRDADKYARFSIEASRADRVDALVPAGVAGVLECRLLEAREIGSVVVVAGEVIAARAVKDSWKRILHHAGGETFYASGEEV
ncbi:MAG TPA: flavin reductase family protein [Treponemataceae bacterium]|jgi:flavin reductase (DIM6/NTAB) family NADH-FMN oxidoreductase RutF|nr:flavin reductase family protein [Treponemataceae bacterium]